jgi:phospholipid N-methyltransferase
MLSFFHEAIRNIRNTGSVMPSSPALASAMTRAIRSHPGCKRVLEVGPGTGPFTAAVLPTLRSGDAFDIVELNPTFCSHLEEKHLRAFRVDHPAITVRLHESAIEDSALDGEYDFIVCGLPFNNFPLPLTESIFKQMLELLRVGGVLTFFEYLGAREVKRPFVGRTHRLAIDALKSFHQQTARAHRVRREIIMANIPPACAVHITKSGSDPCKEAACSASTTTT